MTTMLNAALFYAKKNWLILPLHTPTRCGCSCWKPECASVGKHPRTANGVLAATTDPGIIRGWWTRWPKANIGIATGGGLVVLDVDGDEGRESFRTIKDNLPNAPVVGTGKGFHLYFQSNGVSIKNKVALLPGLDVRGDGGYVVAPPSLHANGNHYRWIKGRAPKDVPLPEFPREILTKLTEGPKPNGTGSAKLPEVVREGKRNDLLFRFAASMRAKGMETEEIEESLLSVNRRRCKPPLDPTEVRRIAESAGRYEPGGPSPSDLSVGEILSEAGLDRLPEDAPTEAVEQALRRLAANVNGADPLRRMAVRDAAMARLKEIGVASPAKWIDAALKESAANDMGVTNQGQELILADVEPWPDLVDGQQMLREIALTFKHHVILPKGGLPLLSLWVVHAHALDAWDISPYLATVSPVLRCAKTLLQDILMELVPRPLCASNITGPAVFRTIEKYQPTLLLDELDTFLEKDEALRGVLNSGHRRRTAYVVRLVGEDHTPTRFSTWSAKTFAKIGDLPQTLADRSIILRMRRRKRTEEVERFRAEKACEELNILCRKAARWAQDHVEALKDADPETPEKLNDRAADNWRPLLAIADLVGGPWPELARKTALLLSGQDAVEDDSAGIQLLADLRDLFRELNVVFLSSDAIVRDLKDLEERPWGEWKRGQPISKNQVASLLKKFGVYPDRDRVAGKQQRGYALESLRDAFARYLPPLNAGESK